MVKRFFLIASLLLALPVLGQSAELMVNANILETYGTCDSCHLVELDFHTLNLLPGVGLNSLSSANLSGADLSGMRLEGVNFSGANLNGANLSNTHLSGANFIGAKIENTNFTGADLKNVRWR